MGGGAAGTLAWLTSLGGARAQLGGNSFLGSIMLVAFDYAPRGFAFCNGQLLPINQNQALFSLLGTQYGGNGITTFALPDLRGRAPVGFSAGTPQGAVHGEENHTLTVNEMPAHGHLVNAGTVAPVGRGRQPPTGNVLTKSNAPALTLLGGATNMVTLAAANLGAAGGSQPHSNLQPYLVMSYVIALQGIFPSRN